MPYTSTINGPIIVSTGPSVADPAWLIRWSVYNPAAIVDSPFTYINSEGTRWQRFLIRLLSKSVARSLLKGVR